jgi:hypothetical protein
MWPLVFAKPRGTFGYWWGMDCEMEWIAQVNTRPDGRWQICILLAFLQSQQIAHPFFAYCGNKIKK